MTHLNTVPSIRQDSQERRFLSLAIAVAIASTIGNTVIALQGGLYADDLRESSRAAVSPWSIEWILGWDTYRHLAPLERAHFSLFVEVAPLSHTFAAGVMGIELLVALLTFYLLARRLLDRWWALAALAVVASSPLLTATHAWLIQGVSLYGVLIGLHLAALGLFGYISDKRRRWLLLAGFGWLLAALTWETWLAGPPILFLLVMLLRDDEKVEDRALGAWRSAEPFWILTAAVVGVYLAAWRLGGFGTGAEPPSASQAVGAVWDSIYLMLVPGFVGGPWEWFAPQNAFSPIVAPGTGLAVLAAVIATVLLLGAFYYHDRRGVVRGVILLFVAPSIAMLLPILGRLTQFPDLVQREPRYIAPSLTMAALGLGLVGQSCRVEHWTRRARLLGVAGICAVIAGILVTDARFVQVWEKNESGDYIATARQSLEQDAGVAEIFDTRVPPSVLNSIWFEEYTAAHEVLRPLMREDVSRFGGANSSLMFDDTGRLVPAQFYPLTWAPLLSCTPIADGQSKVITLGRAQIHEKNLTLRVEASARGAGTLKIESGTGVAEDSPTSTVEMPLSQGRNDAYFLLPERRISEVTVTPEDTSVCVDSVVVGQLAP